MAIVLRMKYWNILCPPKSAANIDDNNYYKFLLYLPLASFCRILLRCEAVDVWSWHIPVLLLPLLLSIYSSLFTNKEKWRLVVFQSRQGKPLLYKLLTQIYIPKRPATNLPSQTVLVSNSKLHCVLLKLAQNTAILCRMWREIRRWWRLRLWVSISHKVRFGFQFVGKYSLFINQTFTYVIKSKSRIIIVNMGALNERDDEDGKGFCLSF